MKFQSNGELERARVSQRVAKRASGSQCESCKEGQWKPECELQKAIESQLGPEKDTQWASQSQRDRVVGSKRELAREQASKPEGAGSDRIRQQARESQGIMPNYKTQCPPGAEQSSEIFTIVIAFDPSDHSYAVCVCVCACFCICASHSISHCYL